MATTTQHTWKFYRLGGLDQVSLETGADLLHLDRLDQKLWVALSCPVKGLELDEQTLALIDADGDGRIRVPELLAAIQWAAARLQDPGILLQGAEALPLAALNDATPEGRALLASARQVLANLGRKDATAITVADSGNTAQIFAASALNGYGVIPPEATNDPAVQALIHDIIACSGGTADRNGSRGVTAAQIATFYTALADYSAWIVQRDAPHIAVLGEGTPAAFASLQAVRAKVDDYFGRCRLVEFDARATAALNVGEGEYAAFAGKILKLTVEEAAGLPLAHIAAGRPLPLRSRVNPAWADTLGQFQQEAVAPVLGADKEALTEADWAALQARFSAYGAWQAGKAGAAVEPLGPDRVREILTGSGRTALDTLLAQDLALEPEFQALHDLHRLTRYHRDMRTLLRNFVNFADFYSRDRWAIFQAGTLYLDSRSTELCLRVDGPSPLAAMSKAYIAYCSCSRAGGISQHIAACFTQGDSDYLFVGRHGVFYDRQGRDWDAVITSIADNPISIRQAFWSPYKKFVRMVEEQVAKRAAAADAESSSRLSTSAETAVNADQAVAPSKKIDVGTVAALGVAVGAIGGALGAIATGLAKLAVWQLPLVLLALVLVISLPSMIIAWLKLRQRTLGPLLEANGWAVNGRVAINIPLGTALTKVAAKPAGARLSLEDPYEDKEAARRRRRTIALLVLAALAAAAIWIRYDRVKKGHYFWQPEPSAVATPVVPAK
ncbi:MAG: hypothetical protein ACHQ5A_04160 [Opitutales bacterium]